MALRITMAFKTICNLALDFLISFLPLSFFLNTYHLCILPPVWKCQIHSCLKTFSCASSSFWNILLSDIYRTLISFKSLLRCHLHNCNPLCLHSFNFSVSFYFKVISCQKAYNRSSHCGSVVNESDWEPRACGFDPWPPSVG